MSWFRVAFLPFLIIEIVFLVLYTPLYWYLIQYLHLDIGEVLIRLILPIGILSFILYVWFRPRVKLLKVKSSNFFGIWWFGSLVVIMFPEYQLQDYILERTSHVNSLKDISEINKKPYSRFYTIDHYFAGKRYTGRRIVSGSYYKRGYYKTYDTYDIYYACPIVTQAPDRYDHLFEAWIGIEYSTEFNSSLPASEKSDRYDAFVKESEQNYAQCNPGDFLYIERLGNTVQRLQYERAAITTREAGYSSSSSHFYGSQNSARSRYVQYSLLVFYLTWRCKSLLAHCTSDHTF
jgi:hypothetical protein